VATKREIKRRIRSVASTKQITKAMELVAAAKLRRARERFEETREYFNKLQQVISEIIGSTEGYTHSLMDKREVKKSLYIVIAADRGLCGGYNSNVFREAVSNMKGKNVSVIAVGGKTLNYFRRRNYEIAGSFVGISEKPTFRDAKQISALALELFEDRKVDEVYLIYTRLITTVQLRPTVMKLLPLTDLGTSTEEHKRGGEILYEPSPERVLDELIPKYVTGTIFGALVEAAASEQSARMTAMDAATDNAEEMIAELTLNYNKVRQASITKEIAEVVGGAEALK